MRNPLNLAGCFALCAAVCSAACNAKTTVPPKPGAQGAGGQHASSSSASDSGVASELVGAGSSLQIAFPTMYSGYSDGSQTFKIAAVVPGRSDVKWSSTDTSIVDLDPTHRTAGDGSVMITTKKAGTVKIIARTGRLAGSASLEITSYDPADCALGRMWYEGDIPDTGIMLPDPGFSPGSPTKASCSYCHSEVPGSTSIEYTPMQTGGWSDQEVRQMFDGGIAPDGELNSGGAFRAFHRVALSRAELNGLLCYLRSIPPGSRGKLDFHGALAATDSRESQGDSGAAAAGASGAQ